MKNQKSFFWPPIIVGILVTLFFLLAFVPKYVELFIERGWGYFSEFAGELSNWKNNPTGFFVTYLLGVSIIWNEQIIGASIIILANLIFLISNPVNTGFMLFFLTPTSIVACLFIIQWKVNKPHKIFEG